ncbi:DNA repair protein RecO [Alicyclobacillus shizuokensis]|uniref:DNA repair protein RecO n=1 Tax=Alicyclobacillus shizuokensis TaxID=392014 RepID=UPI00082D4520|nr:DNA repair protein RecO [Alicyclobacillus shizuokensis]MCL6627192.1 DNA repair protein RecO [Alicyclobacillus shizuokensis]
MVFNTDAIVIRTTAYGENHVIVTLLTPSGKLAVMARGGKRPQSRFVSAIQLGVEGVYSIRRGKGMGTLLQAEVTHSRRRLREHLELAAYAAYFSEQCTRIAEDAPDGSEALYRLLQGALERLVQHPDEASLTSLAWEAKVVRWLGVGPPWIACVLCGQSLIGGETPAPREIAYSGAHGGLLCSTCAQAQAEHLQLLFLPSSLARVLEQFATVPWPRMGRIKLSAASQKSLRTLLRHQLSEYAGLSVKSARFLDSLDL